jgi:hypothetical protein
VHTYISNMIKEFFVQHLCLQVRCLLQVYREPN